MNFKSHTKLLDIEWFDGPMMSLFEDKNHQIFIYNWMNVNPDSHSWLVFRSTPEFVKNYVQAMISERELILLAPDAVWYLVDINPELKFSNNRVISRTDLYPTVLPKSHVYFKEANCPDLTALQRFVQQGQVLIPA